MTLPTNFEPGAEPPEGFPGAASANPQYEAVIANLGGADTTGPIKIFDTLPAGVTPSPGYTPEFRINQGGPFASGLCNVAGQAVSCVVPQIIGPGAAITVSIPVIVSSAPPAPQVLNTVSVFGGGAAPAFGSLTTNITGAVPSFGFLPGAAGFSGAVTDDEGAAAHLAGSHPFALTLEVGLPTRFSPGNGTVLAAGSVKNLGLILPRGVVVNPQATAHCSATELTSVQHGGCLPSTQVGQVYLAFSNFTGGMLRDALYSLVPSPGVPAEFGFDIAETFIHVQGGLGGDFHLSAKSREILAKFGIARIDAELWGNPSDPRHDSLREARGCRPEENKTETGVKIYGCSVPPQETPFLTLPSSCGGPLLAAAEATSWQEPLAEPSRATGEITGPGGGPISLTGCENLAFAPSVSVRPTSQAADSPTGLSVHLHIPQNEIGVGGLATANLKKVTVHLPEGMTVNPPAANGLGACSQAQIDLGSNSPASCPDSSRVGSVEVVTPLLESPLKGSVYVAEQKNNPFDTLLALYLVVEGDGVVIKLPGRVDANSSDGRLTATFDDNPELPFTDLQVDFNGGSRATLVTPGCGSYNTNIELTSWASSDSVTVNSPMVISGDCKVGGFSPKFDAGTSNPVAGAYSPFILQVTQEDGEQNLSRISATLPDGLLARLSGVPLCPDSQASSGDCPPASQIGSTITGVGVGLQPLYIPQPGKAPTAVYLSGPYRGAPYSLVVKVPAQAGPFDLGTIAVRATISVDPFTARVTASSDPLPQILEGIPVAYRDVRVNVDRSRFILNPTSCEPMRLTSTLTSASGVSAGLASRFQVASCERLGFKPELKLILKGGTRRTGHPALKAVVTYPNKGSWANIARAQVGLPHAEFLDQGNLNKACTRPVLLAGKCPKSSVYGHARAWTPLLADPLQGPVYLVGGFGYKLPALVAELNGKIRILLKGRVDTTKHHGIRNTFEAVPDAPVSRFVLQMKGGRKYGLLENSENLCAKAQRANARFLAQSGKIDQMQPKIAVDCHGRRKGKKHKPHHPGCEHRESCLIIPRIADRRQ